MEGPGPGIESKPDPVTQCTRPGIKSSLSEKPEPLQSDSEPIVPQWELSNLPLWGKVVLRPSPCILCWKLLTFVQWNTSWNVLPNIPAYWILKTSLWVGQAKVNIPFDKEFSKPAAPWPQWVPPDVHGLATWVWAGPSDLLLINRLQQGWLHVTLWLA